MVTDGALAHIHTAFRACHKLFSRSVGSGKYTLIRRGNTDEALVDRRRFKVQVCRAGCVDRTWYLTTTSQVQQSLETDVTNAALASILRLNEAAL